MPKPSVRSAGTSEVAARAERLPPFLEDRHRRRLGSTPAPRAATSSRTDVEVLRQLLEVADVPLRRDDPAQPPAGHVEILGEARDDEQVVGVTAGQFEHRARLAGVGQSKVDLVDDEPATAPARHGFGDAPASPPAAIIVPVGFDGDASRTARVARRPVLLDSAADELVGGVRADRHAHRLAFDDPRTRLRLHGYDGSDIRTACVAIDEQRHHQQQRRRRARR